MPVGHQLNVNPPKVGRLDSLKGVRLELAKIYKAGRQGFLDTKEMTRLANVLQILGNLIRDSTLEERISILEETAKHQGAAHGE